MHHAREQSGLGRDAGVLPAPGRLPPARCSTKPAHPTNTVFTYGVGEDQGQDHDARRNSDDQSDVHSQRPGKSGSAVVQHAALLRLDFFTRLIQLVEEDRSLSGRQLDC